MIAKRTAQLHGKNTDAPSTDWNFLLTPDQFFTQLEKERMRCDRTGTVLSLVVFRLPAEGIRDAEASAFGDCLRNRLRGTDHAGFFGKCGNSIGVILWNTDALGAGKFIDAIT
ncbi:MAG: hypothetical protein IID45_04270, partial [Planctomycetes bacterium]|nr:hypothetical protein [Planctomycetota bacterium]